LYAYNLNAQYPLSPDSSIGDDTHGQAKAKSSTDNDAEDGQQRFIDTILLVLEYAPGGELFDILYYTSALAENVARTYFKQIINGLEACHNANVVHRDLKPQNLLLDAKYNLKITDFGLSKIIQSDADSIMKTTYVGTRGYQAPELLLNQKYDLKCDIFSVGVILFILLAGYPPFEQAARTDKWFKPLSKGKYDKFWRAHQKSQIVKIPAAKDLLTRMLCPDPAQRIDMNGIKNHEWFKGETLKQKDLISVIRERHRAAERKRRKDIRKMKDLAQSLNPNKPIPGLDKAQLKEFPADQAERMSGAYTYLEKNQKWYELYNMIEEAVTNKGQGKAEWDKKMELLHCEMNVARNTTAKKDDDGDEKEDAKIVQDKVQFDVEIFLSRQWKGRHETVPEKDEIKANNEDRVFVVKIMRISGDPLVFTKLKNGFLLTYCSSIIKGLPQWARNLEEEEFENEKKEEDKDDVEVEDDYSKALEADKMNMNGFNVGNAIAVSG